MRTLVTGLPDNNLRILHLSTGEAVVKMYSSFVEEYFGSRLLVTANVVEIKVDDSPDLEADVLGRWDYYYGKALAAEVEYLREQYRKTIDDLIGSLQPEKKAVVVEKSEEIIRQIAHGDQHFLIRQDLLKMLKQNI